ncbi:hypothetical protein L21TH_2473 [Caldisalinibacter kiritimatiensis]|uniref:Phosphatidylglycerol lysyltransferase n=1 Tax=Caldisalinibacter kiritimatiensis TaxID=1304284 RepID=R1CRZ6_9FIRM|nr:hypothetical protein L21TH_2473 [Caldisalinibacter kiritimatiensis]
MSSENLADIPSLLLRTNKIYLMLGLLSMVGFWFSDALIIRSISRMVNVKGNIVNSLKLTMIGQYYSAITPFASGGQPAQIYTMVNNSIPVGQATSIMINKFIIYQTIVTFYSIFMFILKVGFVYNNIKPALPFVLIGLILNLIGIITIFALFFNYKILEKALVLVLKIANKIRIINSVEKYRVKIDQHLEEYVMSIEKIKKNKFVALKVSLITVVQLTFYFSVTYFVYLALGFSKASFIDIISIQSLLYMAVSFIPTPGTVGASEGGFYILFNVFFAKNVLVYAILLWRMIIYYFNLFVSGIVTLVDYLTRKNKRIMLEE